ncbi:MAG: monooxygenase [Nitrospiraceae bacterium]|nr:monooxygenase [Nitrospiraceae bacterium]MSR24585.1 monooxygenase [Nitrospiraceae bacterium]
MMERTDVVIVGAGGGGAVLGLALAQKGIRNIVLEQAPGPPTGLRGEILQPNGQQILDRLGVLNKLPADATRSVRHFHFCKVGGEKLCTADYGTLPPPYNRAIVTLPNAAHHVILEALGKAAPGALRYGATFKGLRREGNRVVGVDVERGGQTAAISARLVVGADGAFSKVREALGIPTKLHLYREGYLIVILDSPDGLDEGRYFVGRGEILGLFPAAGRKVYLFDMIPAGSMERVKAQGLEARIKKWISIDPSLEKTFRTLTDWKQTAYMPTGRVKTSAWVADGAVLIGDAAHAMNPHASQGRMQAMVDAMTLVELIPKCLEKGDVSAATLGEFERCRRPQVEMLQRLADEQVIFWNTSNPVLAFLRDRVFRTIGRNRRLSYKVLETTAGLRETTPFGLLDRLMAGGFLPDPNADKVEHG